MCTFYHNRTAECLSGWRHFHLIFNDYQNPISLSKNKRVRINLYYSEFLLLAHSDLTLQFTGPGKLIVLVLQHGYYLKIPVRLIFLKYIRNYASLNTNRTLSMLL